MYFVEKINDGEGKVIRHDYLNDAGEKQTESIALCYSDEITFLITNFMNVYESLYKKEDFVKVVRDFLSIFPKSLKKCDSE
jgi:hypothetical protein